MPTDGARPAIVHLDEHLVVVNKRSGELSASVPGQARDDLASVLEAQLGSRIWVVQRLDFATSGVLLYARTREANRALSETFRTHSVLREYVAALEGEADLPDGQRCIDVPVRGRPARTHFVFLERIGPTSMPLATLTRCRLETGRTHQIRKHARSLGSFVLGDSRHGTKTNHDPPRLALHAQRLSLCHPISGGVLDFVVPLPEELQVWLDGLRGRAAHRG